MNIHEHIEKTVELLLLAIDDLVSQSKSLQSSELVKNLSESILNLMSIRKPVKKRRS